MLPVIQVLGLKHPLTIKFRKKRNKHVDAYYQPLFNDYGDIAEHRIGVYNNHDRCRDIPTLLAHELIHAWQAENNKKDIHGKSFKRMARKLKKHFPKVFNNVYIEALDK